MSKTREKVGLFGAFGNLEAVKEAPRTEKKADKKPTKTTSKSSETPVKKVKEDKKVEIEEKDTILTDSVGQKELKTPAFVAPVANQVEENGEILVSEPLDAEILEAEVVDAPAPQETMHTPAAVAGPVAETTRPEFTNTVNITKAKESRTADQPQHMVALNIPMNLMQYVRIRARQNKESIASFMERNIVLEKMKVESGEIHIDPFTFVLPDFGKRNSKLQFLTGEDLFYWLDDYSASIGLTKTELVTYIVYKKMNEDKF